MAKKQEALIYIEKDNITEAEFMSKSFVNRGIKNRAYINALGAELVMKYLVSEGFNIEELHNIHSISKVLEKIDIADVLLPNIHIDVRVVFDDNQIFIPKSHFDLEIVPDIYLVLKLDEEFDHAEFLGYFKPEQINKKDANKDYYFIAKSKLSSPETLSKFIKDYPGKVSRNLSEEDMLRGRELSVTLADHNITDDEFREFLELLLLNDSLRESVLEFDNFETLAYNVASGLGKSQSIELITPAVETPAGESSDSENSTGEELLNNEEITLAEPELGEDDILLDESFFDDDETESDENNNQSDTDEEEQQQPETDSEDVSDNLENIETDIEEDTLIEEESIDLGDDLLDENLTVSDDIETSTVEEDIQTDIDTSIEESSLPILDEESVDLGEDLLDNDLTVSDDIETSTVEEDIQTDIDTSIEESSLPILDEESVDLGEDLLDNDLTVSDDIETSTMEEDIQIDMDASLEETPLTNLEEETLNFGEDLGEEEIQEIDSLQEETDNEPSEPAEAGSGVNLAESITNALKDSLTGTAAAAAGAVKAETGSIAAGEKASNEAMKLASVAGDLVNDIVNKNIEQQQKNLDKIDYAKSTTDATAVPEHISALAHDLAAAKLEINLEAEESGQFDSPKDLSDLKPIENQHEEVEFQQETIELGNMETVQTEEFTEDTGSIVNLDNLKNIDSPTKPVDNLDEMLKEPDVEKMDLPNLSSFEINEDGTSSFDNFVTDINYNNEEDHLVDLNMPSNEFKIDDDNDGLDFSINTEDDADLSVDKSILGISDTIIDQSQKVEEYDNPDFSNTLSESDLALDTDFDTTMPAQDIQSDSNLNIVDEQLPESNLNNSTPEYSDVDDFSELLSDDNGLSDGFMQNNADESALQSEEDTMPENPSVIPAEEDNQSEQEQDWLNDTNYDNLQDIEIEQQESPSAGSEISDEELITEPDAAPAKAFAVIENSTVISDRTFNVGEIHIDINNPQASQFNGAENESLEDLYDPNSKVPGGSLLQQPGRLGSSSGAPSAGLGIGLKLIGGLVVLAIVCAIGFGAAKLFKAPTEEAPQPITDDITPASSDNGVAESNTLNVNPDNVVKMDNNTNALASTNTAPAAKTKPAASAKTQQQTSSLTPVQKKSMAATTFIEVRKLSWEVPDYVSYNSQFKQYFQAAGKSLKLSLTSDLLLATDYAYSNEIRVSVTFDKDGTFKTAQIVTSSGSTQIDNIVLQTVNQTLKVLKAPHSVGNDESTTAILKIYL